MPLHPTSSTMPNSKYSKCQLPTTILLLSLLWTVLFTGAVARPSLDSLLAKPNDVPQLFLNELLENPNGEHLFHELKKHHQKQPNYLSKWPGLRDLLQTIDYADDTAAPMDNNELLDYNFLDRLRELSSHNNDLFQDVRDYSDESTSAGNSMKVSKSSAAQTIFKDHNAKKNVQYMSPCHFKICNMGRKRNARFTAYNY